MVTNKNLHSITKKKLKKLNTSSHKHEITSILSLVLSLNKPLEYLSFIYFDFNVEHIYSLNLDLHSNHHLMVIDVIYYL